MSIRTGAIIQTLGMLGVGIFLTVMALVGRLSPGLTAGIGVAIITVSLIQFGFAVTHPARTPCPYCSQKILPKVRESNGHLYLTRLDD